MNYVDLDLSEQENNTLPTILTQVKYVFSSNVRENQQFNVEKKSLAHS